MIAHGFNIKATAHKVCSCRYHAQNIQQIKNGDSNEIHIPSPNQCCIKWNRQLIPHLPCRCIILANQREINRIDESNHIRRLIVNNEKS